MNEKTTVRLTEINDDKNIKTLSVNDDQLTMLLYLYEFHYITDYEVDIIDEDDD